MTDMSNTQNYVPEDISTNITPEDPSQGPNINTHTQVFVRCQTDNNAYIFKEKRCIDITVSAWSSTGEPYKIKLALKLKNSNCYFTPYPNQRTVEIIAGEAFDDYFTWTVPAWTEAWDGCPMTAVYAVELAAAPADVEVRFITDNIGSPSDRDIYNSYCIESLH